MPDTDIPRDGSLDATLDLLRDGYGFISKRCWRLGSDVFATRLMLRPAICMQGEEAARVFYEPGRFTRRRALPPNTLALLQDWGSVATLDGEAHRHRKAMVLSLMTPDAIRRLGDLFEEQWRARLPAWERMDRIVLADETQRILTWAVCAWAGVPLGEPEAEKRTRELAAMFEGAGSVGPRNWRGLALRARTERWARGLIGRVRDGSLAVPEDRALAVIARHRDRNGELLSVKTAGVELINILRPTVAVERFITFAALALHQHPDCREPARTDDAYRAMFVQEVRRLYPFFPIVAGRVLKPFDWRGHRFAEGAWVILDLHGTDHDPRLWKDPDRFRPDRFRQRDDSPYDLIPQGGGDHHLNHRCPGEWATIELMTRAVRLLTAAMTYEVPAQDLTIDTGRMPAVPKSRFVIAGVRAVS
ncbi:cytochrome P450 [Azospirillum soli]|uniref:cytochrome P450 n=1 Tax=Azospirillum soli TaxID=1304799 RepID=UPI001AE3822B|nr:cytochrome P450 [Azospirillum soli]MBP2312613.1 fatty-acid peroxygenase [Azospirillum soli]